MDITKPSNKNMKTREVTIKWSGELLIAFLLENGKVKHQIDGNDFHKIETAIRRWLHGII